MRVSGIGIGSQPAANATKAGTNTNMEKPRVAQLRGTALHPGPGSAVSGLCCRAIPRQAPRSAVSGLC